MEMHAGRLRHRIDLQRRVNKQDPVSGAVEPTWVDLFKKVPAAQEFLSSKEFIAAQAVQSEMTVRWIVRFREGMDATQRIKWTVNGKAKIYNVHGVLPDNDSGREWLTLPCSVGLDQG